MHDPTKRFEIEILIKAGLPKARVAEIAGVSVRTVHRVRAEAEARCAEAHGTDATTVPEASHSQAEAGPPGGGPGRPSKTAGYRELVASILKAQPALKTLEVLRRARLAGYRGGKTALYALVRKLRPLAVFPICRFEGVAGEFTQHDLGEVPVSWTGNGWLERVQFFCSRLKFSRYALVVLVDNQRTETLVRLMAEHFERMGGIPLLAVFDRPTTAALKSDPKTGEVLEWNPVFADATERMGLGVDLCWPARPNQKGPVENLVGWVKGSFFKVRQFHDRADLEAQLTDWLVEINERRPCRATRCVPAALLAEVRQRFRPLRLPVSVGLTAMVEHETNKYSMPPEACGFPGTLHLFRDRVRVAAGRYRAEYPRLPAGSRGVSNLPDHRHAMLEAVSGKRDRQYRMREHFFQLGPAAKEVITEIIYAELRSWNDSIEVSTNCSSCTGTTPCAPRSIATAAGLAAASATSPASSPATSSPCRSATRPTEARDEGAHRLPATARGHAQAPPSRVRPSLLPRARRAGRARRLILPRVPRRPRLGRDRASPPDPPAPLRPPDPLPRPAHPRGIRLLRPARTPPPPARLRLRPRVRRLGRLPRPQGPQRSRQDPSAIAIAYQAILHGPDAANVLFHIVDERHRRRRSMVFTTNKPLERWGRVLHDPDLAEAILDRILARGRIATLEGPSMRTRDLDPVPGLSGQ